MNKEIEIRFKITSKKRDEIVANMRHRLRYLEQEDTYLCHETQKENPNYVLRIRKEQMNGVKTNILTYKQLAEDSWIEKEVEVFDDENTFKILELLGHIEYLTINKRRYTTKAEMVEINIDDIDDLGCFIEMEIEGENVEEGKKFLKLMAKTKWNIQEKDIIDEGYVQLMIKNNRK